MPGDHQHVRDRQEKRNHQKKHILPQKPGPLPTKHTDRYIRDPELMNR